MEEGTKPCVQCGSVIQITNLRTAKKLTCSPSCRSKYNAKTAAATREKNMLAKYGVKHPMQRPEIVAKTKATFMENHGPDGRSVIMKNHWSQVSDERKSEIRAKASANTDYQAVAASMKQTNKVRYGVENAMQVPSVVARSTENRAAARDQIYKDIRTKEWWDEHYVAKKLSLSALSRMSGVTDGTLSKVANELGIQIRQSVSISSVELIIRQALVHHSISYETNVKGLLAGSHEIDIWLPEFKLGIEVHGVYWHSDAVKSGIMLETLHFNKFLWARQKGIRLLQFWDYEVINDEQSCIDVILECIGKKSLGSFDYTDEVITDNRLGLDRYMDDYDPVELIPPKEWAVKNFAELVPIEEDNTSIRIWDAGYTRWRRHEKAQIV